MGIVFNKPYSTGGELEYIAQSIASGKIGGDGPFTEKCNNWLETRTGSTKALLTHSCTAALEMAAILCDIQPGDEVILPSFSFVTTANAFVLRGGVPVFVDIRADTLNIDESLIEEAITPRTKAIVPVHYAGVGCEMDAILAIANRYDLVVIEDAAQGIMASYKGRALGSMAEIGCYSFHETKNLVSGEGGALLINNAKYEQRAEIIREKGTNRSQFFRGEVDKYTWVDIGSSYLPSDIVAALLWSQFEQAEEITRRRVAIWNKYHEAFAPSETSGVVRRPSIPAECIHNGHMYYLILPSPDFRTKFIEKLKSVGIQSTFHYVPLHSSPFGSKVAKTRRTFSNTDDLSDRLVRLPLWLGLEEQQDEVISHALDAIRR